jgi:Leucine-rich repeat (LRR) protein
MFEGMMGSVPSGISSVFRLLVRCSLIAAPLLSRKEGKMVQQMALAAALIATLCSALAPPSPDQAAMLRFVQPIVDACGRNPWGSGDVCAWPVATCDEAQRVTEIHIGSNPCQTNVTLDLMLTPPLVKILDMPRYEWAGTAGFAGTVSFASGAVVEKIVLSQNYFTFIDFSALPRTLVWLDVSYNQIAAPLDMRALPRSVVYLIANNNRLSGQLDLSYAPPYLRQLSLAYNALDSLVVPAQLPPNIWWGTNQAMDLSYNALSSITYNGGIQGVAVDLSHNRLTSSAVQWERFAVPSLDLSFNAMESADLSELPSALEVLHLKGNALTSVKLAGGNPALRELDLSRNALPAVDFTALPSQLQTIYVNDNRITFADLSALPPALTQFAGSAPFFGNPLSGVKFSSSWPSGIITLDLSGLNFTAFDISAVPDGLQQLILRNNAISSVVLSGGGQLVLLDLSGNQLTSLNFSGLPRTLSFLDVGGNRFTTIDLSDLPPRLYQIGDEAGVASFAGNPIGAVSFGSAWPKYLPALDLSHQRLTSFDLGAVPKGLSKIDLSFNNITSVASATSSPVQCVNLTGNAITALPWDQLPGVAQYFLLDHNLLTAADFSRLPSTLLQISGAGPGILTLAGNPLRSVRMVGTLPPAMHSIVFNGDGYRLTEVSVGGAANPGVRRIDLSNNALSAAAVAWTLLQNTVLLNVSNNSLTAFDFAALPRGLVTLDLSFNRIAAMAFGSGGITALQDLYMRSNALTSVDYATLPGSLQLLVLRDNQLSGPLTWAAPLKELQWLDVSLNKFSGSLDFASFPKTLTTLLVAGNQLSGTVDWALLQTFKMENLWVQFNQLNGPVDLSFIRLDGSMPFSSFIASHNQFTGSLVLPHCHAYTYNAYIDVSFNRLSGALNLTAISCLEYLIASHNGFSGELNIPAMPLFLADVSSNDFSGAFTLPSNAWYRDVLNISANSGLCGMAKTQLACTSITVPASCRTQTIGNDACVVTCPKCP